jgi:RNA ligase (TIGR02306 family)
MRKLASVQKIVDVQPIEGADLICKYKVNNWWVVDGVGKYGVGDFVVYCEIDSFLPIREEYEFLRKSSYKKLVDGTEGFRIKTIKLRGQVSQGLIIPCDLENPEEDLDMTDSLGIIKYEPPIPACLAGMAKGNFPAFLHKTDEERVQNIKSNVYEEMYNHYWFYVTEKLDGSSMTCYKKDGVFGVCSRNLDLKETEGNTFWSVARELDIESKLSDNFAIQGELIGPGIQGNPYKLTKHNFYVFNLYDINEQKFLKLTEIIKLCSEMKLETVPVLNYQFTLPETVDELLKYAEGKSVLNGEAEREGVVIRTEDKSISFKAISNKFLLKNGD